MTFREEVREILESRVLRPTSAKKLIGGVEMQDGELVPISPEEATAAILEAVMKKVPEPKQVQMGLNQYAYNEYLGFNAAIDTIKQNLGE